MEDPPSSTRELGWHAEIHASVDPERPGASTNAFASRFVYSPKHKGNRAEVSSENQVGITTIDRAKTAVTGNGRGT